MPHSITEYWIRLLPEVAACCYELPYSALIKPGATAYVSSTAPAIPNMIQFRIIVATSNLL